MYHWHQALKVIRYLNHTKERKLNYTSLTPEDMDEMIHGYAEAKHPKQLENSNAIIDDIKTNHKENFILMEQFADSDWATDKSTRKSQTGHCLFMYGNLVSWGSSRQQAVSLSSTEAEYIAMTTAIKDGLYFKNLVGEVFGQKYVAVELKDDNQGAIFIALNTVNNNRTKHIDIRHHFIRDVLQSGSYFISKVHTNYNVADFFTKTLAKPKFIPFMKDLLRISD
jgi:hypothetical protein